MMNDQNLPMTSADWSWLFSAKPQPQPAGDPMQLASAPAAPMPPVRPASFTAPSPAPARAAPAAPVPTPPTRPASFDATPSDSTTYGGVPSPAAFTNLGANPTSGSDAAAMLQARQPYGRIGFNAPSADPSPEAKAMMMALVKRGLISPEQIAAMGSP